MKACSEKHCCTRSLPACPIRCLSLGSVTNFCMASEKHSGVGSQRKPVSPWATDSSGPPVLTAITGQREYMASMGTMPKCSLLGVYSTQVLLCSKDSFCLSEKERRKVTWSSRPREVASERSSSLCSTFSTTRSS